MTTTTPTAPAGTTGLEGWTSCCNAAVTCVETGATVCKSCYREVALVDLDGDAGDRLDEIVHAVIRGEMTAEQGIEAQRNLLTEAL